MCPLIAKSLKKYAKLRGSYISDEQVAAMVIPNTTASLACYAWMHDHFELVGDAMPNLDGEIHLEPTEMKTIWQEYHDDMVLSDTLVLQFDAFSSIWNVCFQHVKIREFKAVTGKCETCAKLSEGRRTYRDARRRQELTMLHQLHRGLYMGERIAYAVCLYSRYTRTFYCSLHL
jgi:hypothetical protein